MGRANHGFTGRDRVVVGLAGEIGDVDEARRYLVSPASLADAVLEHGGKGAAVKRVQIFFFGQGAQPSGIFGDNAVAHGHLFVEFDAHLEDLAEVLLILVEQFVQRAVANEDHFDVDVDSFRLLRAPAEGIEHFEGLNFQAVVVQRAL